MQIWFLNKKKWRILSLRCLRGPNANWFLFRYKLLIFLAFKIKIWKFHKLIRITCSYEETPCLFVMDIQLQIFDIFAFHQRSTWNFLLYESSRMFEVKRVARKLCVLMAFIIKSTCVGMFLESTIFQKIIILKWSSLKSV